MINTQTDTRTELNNIIALGQALQRLEKNEDFLAVIKDGYITKTLLVYSQGVIDQSPPMRQEALEKVLAATYLRQYLTSIKSEAVSAVEELNSGEL